MFTWICPVCGAEVPPSQAECPRCAERRQARPQPAYPGAAHAPAEAAAQAAPQAGPPGWGPAPAPPPPPAWPAADAAGQAPPPPAPPAWAPPPAAAPQPQQTYLIGETKRRTVPPWLAALLTLAVIGGGLLLLYRFLSAGRSGTGTAQKAAPFESPNPASSSHPFAKYLEVTGVRLLEGADKKLMARFVVVNHAPADLTGFRLKITLEAANAPPGEAVIAIVEASPGTIPMHGIKDMEAPLVTPLRVYELPDWQFVRARAEIIDAK